MVNLIIEGVASALYEALGDGYAIFRDDLRQGLEPPCLLILAVGPSLDPQPSNVNRLTVPLDISFYPEDGGDNTGMYQVGLKVMEAAELISLTKDKRLRGLRRSMDIVDGVLHVAVTYEVFLRKVASVDPMRTLDLDLLVLES